MGGSSSAPPSGGVPTTTPEKPKKFAMEDHVLVTQGPDEETEDGVIRNRDAIRKIRDTWIYKQVRLRQDEFTHYRTVRIAMICFNNFGVLELIPNHIFSGIFYIVEL